MEAVLILRDPPNSGAWNMAVDEALLERAKEIGPVLRFYEWSPATLSLGYFQSARQRLLHPPSRNCPLVRRPSGGGAILHDRELTYALVVPAGHPWARSREQLYFMVHEALAETLVRWGIRASLVEGKECRPDQGAELAPEVSSGMPTSGPLAAGGVGKADDPAAAEQVVPAWDLACGTQLRVSEASLSAADQPFMCFARRSCGDLVVGPHKIAGSRTTPYCHWHPAAWQHSAGAFALCSGIPWPERTFGTGHLRGRADRGIFGSFGGETAGRLLSRNG